MAHVTIAQLAQDSAQLAQELALSVPIASVPATNAVCHKPAERAKCAKLLGFLDLGLLAPGMARHVEYRSAQGNERKADGMLETMLESGLIKLEGNTYVGTASDGVEVQLGCIGDEQAINSYLAANPCPENW